MQNTEVIDKALSINKTQVRKYVRSYVHTHRPNHINKLQNKYYLESIIFVEGYIEAIKKEIQLPIRSEEITQMLLEQALKYVLRQID